jgi:hypothetical protein
MFRLREIVTGDRKTAAESFCKDLFGVDKAEARVRNGDGVK